MFETLSNGFRNTINKIRFNDDEKALDKALDELKKVLLKSDVYHKTTKEIVQKTRDLTKQNGIGRDNFLNALSKSLLDIFEVSGNYGFVYAKKPPTNILMSGLQGSGKTTTSAKIANYLKMRNKKVLLVPCDLQRLAAVTQLKTLGEQIAPFTLKAQINISDQGNVSNINVVQYLDEIFIKEESVTKGNNTNFFVDTRTLSTGTHTIQIQSFCDNYLPAKKTWTFSIPSIELPDGGLVGIPKDNTGQTIFYTTTTRQVIGKNGMCLQNILDRINAPLFGHYSMVPVLIESVNFDNSPITINFSDMQNTGYSPAMFLITLFSNSLNDSSIINTILKDGENDLYPITLSYDETGKTIEIFSLSGEDVVIIINALCVYNNS